MGSSSARARRVGSGRAGGGHPERAEAADSLAPGPTASSLACRINAPRGKAGVSDGVVGGWGEGGGAHGMHVVITGDGCRCAADERDRRPAQGGSDRVLFTCRSCKCEFGRRRLQRV